ncbi:ribonuclease HII [Candidatus Woesearchaeota archaeon]|nr:ribonuclease HII [Candidatus Woesearchaeota archaeon]
MTIICGIDEAGRGPVIGPLVMAGVALNKEDEHILRSLGVTDSKLLSAQKREELYQEIIKLVAAYEIVIVSVEEIDHALSAASALNLNWLEAEKCSIILNKLIPDAAYIDCPSTNIEEYTNYLKKSSPKKTKLFVQHKADLNHLICSAASIFAKVTRDREIEKLKQQYNIDFGSGYASDPKTQNFIKDNYNLYPFFRKSWDTYKKVIISKQQKKLTLF